MKIALLVVYNHRFDRNIPIIEKHYGKYFSYIYHIVPFYDGKKDNVIPVYECSYQFQGYIAQAYQYLKNRGFTHFFIIADDMIINPQLNEDNIFDFLKIKESDDFITSFLDLSSTKWDRVYNAIFWDPYERGTEIRNIIPSEKEAYERLKLKGFDSLYISNSAFLKYFIRGCWHYSPKKSLSVIKRWILNIWNGYRLLYPMVGGYADIFLLTANSMDKISNYLGAFAAQNLFVEIAFPTSFLLVSNSFKTLTDIGMKGQFPWKGAITDDIDFAKKYDYNLSKLINDYPKDYLYLHPIKLSKWK